MKGRRRKGNNPVMWKALATFRNADRGKASPDEANGRAKRNQESEARWGVTGFPWPGLFGTFNLVARMGHIDYKACVENTGRSAAWLARLLGVQEVVGSNPAGPTVRKPLGGKDLHCHPGLPQKLTGQGIGQATQKTPRSVRGGPRGQE